MRVTDLIENQLMSLRLHGVRDNLSRRLKQATDEKLGFEDFLNMILQDEAEHRSNGRIKRLLKQAAFRQQASLEALDYAAPRGLDRKVVSDLAGCRFIENGHNILILGPTGVGKTYLASAIGNAACRNGYSTYFFRMNNLIEQTTLSRAKGTYLNLVKRLAGCSLLILDDFGIKPLQPQQFQDLYDILDERSEGRSTIITSQLPAANWNEVISDPVTCEAISDRIAAKAINIVMKGVVSYRKKLFKQGD